MSKGPLTVRRWTMEDIPVIQDIAITTWLATYGAFIPESDIRIFHQTQYTNEKLARYCMYKELTGFLGCVDGVTAGFANTFMSVEEERFYLNSLYVLPQFQNQGIGRKLFETCEDLARGNAYDAVWLGVMKQNLAALQWYRGMGFEFVEESPFSMGETTVLHLIGYKKISNEPA